MNHARLAAGGIAPIALISALTLFGIVAPVAQARTLPARDASEVGQPRPRLPANLECSFESVPAGPDLTICMQDSASTIRISAQATVPSGSPINQDHLVLTGQVRTTTATCRGAASCSLSLPNYAVVDAYRATVVDYYTTTPAGSQLKSITYTVTREY